MDKLNLLFCGEKMEEGWLFDHLLNIFTALVAKIRMLGKKLF